MKSTEVAQALNWRYATKKFDPTQRISEADWMVLEESFRLSPSSYGLQLWRFLVVDTPSLREKLRAASWNQSQVTDASHYVVLAFKESVTNGDVDRFLTSTAQIRGMELSKLDGYKKVIQGDLIEGKRANQHAVWSQRQTYIAMGFAMLTAAMMKIDTCPMEGIDPEAYDEVLGLKGSGYKTVAGLALGYRSSEDAYAGAKKVRYPVHEVIEHR